MLFDTINVRSRQSICYLDNQLEIVEIPNHYDSEEVIEIYTSGNGCVRVPINNEITLVPILGMVFFRNKDIALNMKRTFVEDRQSIFKTSKYTSMKNEKHKRIVSHREVKNGIYSIANLDSGGDQSLIDRFVVVSQDDKHIYKIKQLDNDGSPESEVIIEYLEREATLDGVSLANNKILFEIKYDKKECVATITHYVVNLYATNHMPEFITQLNTFKLFRNVVDAQNYIYNIQHLGSDYVFDMPRIAQEQYAKDLHNKQVKKEARNKILNILWGIVWNHKDGIINKGSGIIKTIIANRKLAKSIAIEMEKQLSNL